MPTRRRKNFYAVVKGVEPEDTGVYDNWLVAEPIVKHASGACFKGYQSFKEAVEHMRQAGIQNPIIFTRDQNGVTSQMSVANYLAAGLKKEGMSFLSSPMSAPVDDGEDSIELSPELTELTMVSIPLHLTSTPVSAADPQTDTIRKSLYINITSPKVPTAPTESLIGDRSPLIPSAPLEPQVSPVLAVTPLVPLNEPRVKPKTPSAPSESLMVTNESDMVMLDNCVGTQTDTSVENDLLDELQSLKKQLKQCKSEKKSLLSEKDEAIRKCVKLQSENGELVKKIEELEALAIANDFPTLELSRSYISEVTITLQNNMVPQVSTISINHEGITSWMKNQLAPMGEYPEVPEEQEKNLEYMEELPFYRISLSSPYPEGPIVPPESDHVPDNVPIALHDPSLPPVLFKLDSAYPELSNLYHIPGYLKLWGEKFKSKEHGYVWRKAKFHGDDNLANRVLKAKSAWKAMSLGRNNITPCDEWENSVKFEAMHELQIAALEQCDVFRNSLIDTGKRPLREDTDHMTWGYLKGGQNKLGHLYEELRYSLQMQQLQGPADGSDNSKDNSAATDRSEPEATPSDQATGLNPHAPSFRSNHSSDEGGPRTIMTYGDSNTQGIHPRIDNTICRTVPIPGGTVCPIPGRMHLTKFLPTALSGDESTVILQGGANDALSCNPVEFKENYRCLVQTAGSKGADVICSGIFHRADMPTHSEVIMVNTRIDILNSIIQSVASEEGATYLDNTGSVGSSATQPNTNILSAQYLHLNARGRVDLSQRIAAMMKHGPTHQSTGPPQMNTNIPPPPSYHHVYPARAQRDARPAQTTHMGPGSNDYLSSCVQSVDNWFNQSYPRRNRYWGTQ